MLVLVIKRKEKLLHLLTHMLDLSVRLCMKHHQKHAKEEAAEGEGTFTPLMQVINFGLFLFRWQKAVGRNSLPHSVSLLGYQGCGSGLQSSGLIDSNLMELGTVEWVGRGVCYKDLEAPMRNFFLKKEFSGFSPSCHVCCWVAVLMCFVLFLNTV